MFDFDIPITREDQDELNYAPFARSIANAIVSQQGNDSYVIGIYGKWGSGKTSLMNLLANYLREDQGDRSAQIVISFSCWGARSVGDLLAMFADSLTAETKRLGKAKKAAEKAAKGLSRYADAISSGLPSELKPIASALGQAVRDDASAAKAKKHVARLLSSQNARLVVVLDDIDRLPSDQIKNVFRFVNTVADFKNVVYILPFDYDVVVESLSGIQGADGAAYMEKVVQIPLSMPAVSGDSLLRILDREVGSFAGGDVDERSQAFAYEVIRLLIRPYLSTMRDVKRLSNVIRFQLKLLADELNTLDIIGLSALLTFQPILYRWVTKNKDLLVGTRYGTDQRDIKKTIEQTIKNDLKCDEQDAKLAVRSLGALFHMDASRSWALQADRRERRVCHPDYFDAYFLYSIQGANLPSRSAIEAFECGDIDLLVKVIDESMINRTFGTLLTEFQSRIDIPNYKVKPGIIECLLGHLGKYHEDQRGGMLWISAEQRLLSLVKSLIRLIGKNETGLLLARFSNAMDYENYLSFASLVNAEELSHGRLAAKGEQDIDKQFLLVEDLESLEKAFLTRTNEFFEKDGFVPNEKARMAMYLWSCFDEAGYKQYWSTQLSSNPVSVCYLIDASSGLWSSSTGAYGWVFSESVFGKIETREELASRVEKLKSEGAFEDTDEELLVKVISFFKIAESGDDDEPSFNEAMARQLIPEWRSPRQGK